MLREYSTVLEKPNCWDDDTFYHLLELRADAHPDDIAASYLDPDSPKRQWVQVRADEMHDAVRKIAKGLLALGLHKGDRAVIFSATSYGWALTDFACSAIGVVTVPIYETDSAGQATAIVHEVRPAIAFADTEEHWQILDAACGSSAPQEAQDDQDADNHGSPHPQGDGADDAAPGTGGNDGKGRDGQAVAGVYSYRQGALQAIMELGRSVTDDRLDQAIKKVRTDDIATIVYTSGSTGRPKGVELSYRNFIVTVRDGWEVLPDMLITPPNRLLLFLPLAHCFARYIEYVCIGGRGTVGYVSDAHHLLSDMRTFKPTYLLGVPRVFEKVYNAASQRAGAGFKGRFLRKAYEHYVAWSKAEQDGTGHSLSEKMAHTMYEQTIGDLVRDALGGQIHWLACGGAPIDNDLAHFFNGIDGLTFIQGYGMTETAAPCLVNFQDRNRIGSVGLPGPGISVRLSDDEELLIKGPCVFKGYLDRPEQTREAFTDDGWLKTGDLAAIDDDGFVFITGRKKDLIITAGGKNVSPAPMEKTLSQCEIISHAVVLGDKRPFISALITLDPGMLAIWLKKNHLDPSIRVEDADSNPAVRAFVQSWVDRANRGVSRAESIRKFVILPTDFTQEDGTMTPSMKVVRPAVIRTYADVIDHQIYTPRPGTQPGPSDAAVLLDRMGQTARAAGESVRRTAETSTQQISTRLASLTGHGKDDGEDGDDDGDGHAGEDDAPDSGSITAMDSQDHHDGAVDEDRPARD